MDQPIMPPIQDEQGNNNDVTFNVMPQGGKNFAPPNVPTPQAPSPGSSMTIGVHSSKNKWIYIILGIIVVLALGAGAYYLLGKKSAAPVEDTTDKLSKVWLTQYFNVDTCADETTCGLHVDPDTDGLDNFAEFKAKTNPLNPDSDMDGLADGDEINIYKTDPTLKYTDQRSIVVKNDWSDGFQIKGGYDPLTPGVLFTESRKQQIEDDKAKFNLHEPSITTTTAAPADPTADWKTYTNTEYGFEVKYPSDWNFSSPGNCSGNFQEPKKFMCLERHGANQEHGGGAFSNGAVLVFTGASTISDNIKKHATGSTVGTNVKPFSASGFTGNIDSDNKAGLDEGEIIYAYITSPAGKVVVLSWMSANNAVPSQYSYQKYLLPILSTFKFPSKDCGTDFGCFTSSIVNCSLSSVVWTNAIEDTGIIITTKTYLATQGIVSSNCQLYIRYDDITASAGKGSTVTKAGLDIFNNAEKKTMGTTLTCSIPSSSLSKVLSDMKKGSVHAETKSSTDIGSGNSTTTVKFDGFNCIQGKV